MDTVFGPLMFKTNGTPIEIEPIIMPNQYKHFQVDKRFMINLTAVREPNQMTTIECEISPTETFFGGPSTGQDLAQVTFTGFGKKLSIGTVGDLNGIRYEYFDYGMRLVISKDATETDFIFLVAWCDSDLADTDSAEFLADPTWSLD